MDTCRTGFKIGRTPISHRMNYGSGNDGYFLCSYKVTEIYGTSTHRHPGGQKEELCAET